MANENTETDARKRSIQEIQRTLADLDILLTYVGKNGKKHSKELIAALVECKHFGPIEKWTKEQETTFWITLNTVTSQIKPVTITSLKTFSPNLEYTPEGQPSKSQGNLSRIISQYGIIAAITVLLIIGLQTYHLVGQDVLTKSQDLFNIRNDVRGEIKRKEADAKKLAEAITTPSTQSTPKANSNITPNVTPNATVGNIPESHSPQEATRSACAAEDIITPQKAKYLEILGKDEDYQILKGREQVLDQEFDANRTIMYRWNLVWRLGVPLSPELSVYDQYRYNREIALLTQQLLTRSDIKEYADCSLCLTQQLISGTTNTPPPSAINTCKQHCDLDEVAQTLLAKDYHFLNSNSQQCADISTAKSQLTNITTEKYLHQSRDLYFRSLLNATFVLNLLNNYLLPMLYGCLGALSMVLRSLCQSIKEETYTSSCMLDYNMRIVLGTVSGMAAGLFLGDASLFSDGNFSRMLISFVLGYNVDVLFKVVDQIANKIAPGHTQTSDPLPPPPP